MVFVLDKHKRPLMPCSEKRARLLLTRGRAVVHRRYPFVIRLKDRLLAESDLQPVLLKVDPGSQTTGVALVREEQSDDGVVHHALHLAEIVHHGNLTKQRLVKRANARRRRRVHLRYRPPRFLNRRRRAGWLPPALRSRLGNLVTWTQRYADWLPLCRIEVEDVRFDTQALHNPEITGVEYQRGALFGYEVWEYLLWKWGHRCAYCSAEAVPLEKDHITPRSRGGSDRVTNLAVACRDCNQRKGSQTATEFGYPQVQARANAPLKDAAALNSLRKAISQTLAALGWPVQSWTGGRTKWNRERLNLPKTHALDALCVGASSHVTHAAIPVLHIRAMGRGSHCRTNFDGYGFPRGYRMRHKQVHGFQTGDLVCAVVRSGKHAGRHVGRVRVRATGSFRVGSVDGIAWRYCQLLQRQDGYDYNHQKGVALSPRA